jgi:hypothetical protein
MEDSFWFLVAGGAQGGEKWLITGLQNNRFHSLHFLTPSFPPAPCHGPGGAGTASGHVRDSLWTGSVC